jgi:hypothetical protein
MDDTIWHSESHETLQNILNDVTELYKINNIQVNPHKSDLLHLQPSKSPTPTTDTESINLNFDNQTIQPRKTNETIRYLGIYFDGKGSTQPTQNIITNKINQFNFLIQNKKLLPIQISRLFNTILIPSIEYLLQIITLTQQKTKKLSSSLTKNIKHMLHLPINTNNDILTNPLLLNIPTLEKFYF